MIAGTASFEMKVDIRRGPQSFPSMASDMPSESACIYLIRTICVSIYQSSFMIRLYCGAGERPDGTHPYYVNVDGSVLGCLISPTLLAPLSSSPTAFLTFDHRLRVFRLINLDLTGFSQYYESMATVLTAHDVHSTASAKVSLFGCRIYVVKRFISGCV